MSTNDILVCIRTKAKPPIERSVKQTCSRCSTDVWVSPTGVRMIQEKHLDIICVACMVTEVNNSNELPEIEKVTPEQMEEIITELIKEQERLKL